MKYIYITNNIYLDKRRHKINKVTTYFDLSILKYIIFIRFFYIIKETKNEN